MFGFGNYQEFCTACGSTGKPKTMTRGSIVIEIILWLCFLVPGLIYSIWRLTTRYQACRFCFSDQLVPLGSPIAKKMQHDLAMMQQPQQPYQQPQQAYPPQQPQKPYRMY